MKLLLIPLFLLSVRGLSQSVPGDTLDIELLNDSLQVTVQNSLLTVSVKITNNGERHAIMYGYYSNQIRPNRSVDKFCDPEKLGAGIAVFVWNSSGLQHFSAKYLPNEIKYTPITSDSLQLRMTKARKRYLEGTKILKGFGFSIDDIRVDLTDFELKPGFYKLCLVYFSGKMLEKVTVGEEQVMIDQNRSGGLLVEGCIVSNLITFVVDKGY